MALLQGFRVGNVFISDEKVDEFPGIPDAFSGPCLPTESLCILYSTLL